MGTPISAEWLAGFIDGEGTITANVRPGSSGRDSVHYRTMIFNTNLPALQAIHRQWGGRLSLYAKPRSPKHKPVYCIYWGGGESVTIIQAVKPFLLLKRRQAELLLRFHVLALPRGRARRAGVSPRLAARRHKMVEQMAALNRRGL